MISSFSQRWQLQPLKAVKPTESQLVAGMVLRGLQPAAAGGGMGCRGRAGGSCVWVQGCCRASSGVILSSGFHFRHPCFTKPDLSRIKLIPQECIYIYIYATQDKQRAISQITHTAQEKAFTQLTRHVYTNGDALWYHRRFTEKLMR